MGGWRHGGRVGGVTGGRVSGVTAARVAGVTAARVGGVVLCSNNIMLLRVFVIAIFFVARPAISGGQFYVTNGADSGPRSLRQAILDANEIGPCPEPNPLALLILFELRHSPDDPP